MSALGRRAAFLAASLLITGCSFGPKKQPFDFRPFVARDPRSVVVAPVANAGPEALAGVLARITQPLAERGYYVLPVRMTQELAARNGFKAYPRKLETWWDSERNHSGQRVVDNPEDAERIKGLAIELAAYFGADSVLFVQVLDWRHDLNTSEGYFSNWIDEKKDHAVGLDYLLADDRGQTIWRAQKHIVYSRGGGSLASEIWNASRKPSDAEINTALARQANWWVINGARRVLTNQRWYFDSVSMPVGPYHPNYKADRARRSGAR